MRRVSRILATLLALGAVNAADAIPLNFEFQGTVDAAAEGNAFGLIAGDSIFGFASVDGTGVGAEFFTPLEGLDVFFQVGDLSFSTEQDFSWPFFPQLSLTDGQVDFFDFFAFDGEANLFFTSAFPDWFAIDGSGLEVIGSALTAQAVPEPGTVALLAIGLLGLGLARRRVA